MDMRSYTEPVVKIRSRTFRFSFGSTTRYAHFPRWILAAKWSKQRWTVKLDQQMLGALRSLPPSVGPSKEEVKLIASIMSKRSFRQWPAEWYTHSFRSVSTTITHGILEAIWMRVLEKQSWYRISDLRERAACTLRLVSFLNDFYPAMAAASFAVPSPSQISVIGNKG